jgi:hypothetical protein
MENVLFAANHANGVAVPCTDALVQGRPASQTLSKQFWNCDLSQRLPRTLTQGGTQAVAGDITRIRAFLMEQFACLTEEASHAAQSEFCSQAKRRYLASACDLIELRHAGETVGAIVGAPEDWATYYVRFFAITPDFQKPALVRRFARECLFEPLAASGVPRICAETSPANRAMARLFSELSFLATGQQLSDRWGPLVRYTKFLDPACESVFLQRFGSSAP